MTRFSVAKDQLVMGLDDVVRELWGGGKNQVHMHAGRWEVLNRWRAGADMSQMSIWRTGARRGAFKDYGGTEKGDAIDMVAYGLTGAITAETRMQALEWIENRFGIRTMDPATRQKIDAAAKVRRERQVVDEDKRQHGARERARKQFYAAEAKILGSPVEAYAAVRGVALGQVPQLTVAFRYMPNADFWPMRPRDGEGNAIGPAPQFPAMISAMSDGAGKLGANHFTFLEPGTFGKLDTRARGYIGRNGKPLSAKMMFPETSGLVIRVTRGPTGLNCEDAAAKGLSGWLVVTEGIEDAWSWAIGDPDLRVHAAGSLSGLLGVPDLPCVKGYLIPKDNDWGKPQAQAAFDAAMARFRSFGKPAEVLSIPADWGKDGNDVLNWKG